MIETVFGFLLILCIACMTCQAGLNSLGSMPPIAFQVESDIVYNLEWLEEPWCSVWRQPQWGTSAASSTIVNRTGLSLVTVSFIWQLKASFFCQYQTCVACWLLKVVWGMFEFGSPFFQKVLRFLWKCFAEWWWMVFSKMME